MTHGSEDRRQPHDEQHTSVDWGQAGIVTLVALAIVASVVMLLTSSATALRLALIAALWAAVIGAFIAFRYRGQAQHAQERLVEQEDFHRQQLDTLHNSPAVQPAPSVAEAEVLREIREELASLRAQLEELSGRSWDFEPAGLRAEARRIMELEAQTLRAERPATSEMPVIQPEPTEAERPEPRAPEGYSGVPSADAVAGRLGSQPTSRRANPLVDLIQENEQRKQRENEEQQDMETQPPVEPERGDGDVDKQAPTTVVVERVEENEPQGGRRRRDDNENALTVAELLERARQRREEQ